MITLRYWRHHSLEEMTWIDDLLAACRLAIDLEDDGQASIEEIDADGVVLTGIQEIEEWYELHGEVNNE